MTRAGLYPGAADAGFAGFVRGLPLVILRAEAAVVFAAAILTYAHIGGGWGRFLLLFLVPDLAMLAYLLNAKAGAYAYNAAHTYGLALLLGGVGFAQSSGVVMQLACIWVAHVGFDRMLGYGLKYPRAFGDTHLGRIGRAARQGAVTP